MIIHDFWFSKKFKFSLIRPFNQQARCFVSAIGDEDYVSSIHSWYIHVRYIGSIWWIIKESIYGITHVAYNKGTHFNMSFCCKNLEVGSKKQFNQVPPVAVRKLRNVLSYGMFFNVVCGLYFGDTCLIWRILSKCKQRFSMIPLRKLRGWILGF